MNSVTYRRPDITFKLEIINESNAMAFFGIFMQMLTSS